MGMPRTRAPTDPGEVWDERCPACLMKMHLVLANDGPRDIDVYHRLAGHVPISKAIFTHAGNVSEQITS